MALRDLFLENFGREPSEAELNFFNKRIGEGFLTEYEAGLALSGEPEAQARRLPGMVGQYADYLGKSDEEVLGRASDVARSTLMRQGRPDTSTLTAAIASAGRDLALSRRQTSGAMLGGGLGSIFATYANRGARATERSNYLVDEDRHRGWAITDFALQRDAYADQLRTQGRQNFQSGLMNTAVKGLAMGAGYAIGGPAGAYMGSLFAPGGGGGGGGMGGMGGGGNMGYGGRPR